MCAVLWKTNEKAVKNYLTDFSFQNQVKTDTGTSSIPFSERMGDVHFYIFFDNFIKSGLGHFNITLYVTRSTDGGGTHR